MSRTYRTILAAVLFALTNSMAHAADPARTDATQHSSNDNKADVSKRIVYRIDGMTRVVTKRDLFYKSDGDTQLLMNVYTPPNLAKDVSLPVVVFIHGGPITTDMGQPTQWGVYQSYGELVAASGFVGVTFNHRLLSQNDYGRSKLDVEAAIEYVRAHAQELHVDVNRIALWIASGGGPHLSWILRDRPTGLRCAVAFYSILDLRQFLPDNADANVINAVERLSAAAQVKEHGAGLPIFIARAGLDTPQINQGIDRFVSEALAANLDIEVMNHSHGQHNFDVLDDDDRSREIIAAAVVFLQVQLKSK